jgi:hypothetical protein
VHTVGQTSKGKDPDPEFTPGREFEMEDEGENQGFTPVTRRRTRAMRVTDLPATLQATKKAAARAVNRIMETEGRGKAEAAPSDKLALLHKLVESLLRQIQARDQRDLERDRKDIERDQREQEHLQELRKQGRTIEALHALF